MTRSVAACALAVALFLSACGGSSDNRNIGRQVQREFRLALDRSGDRGRRPATFAIDRCRGEQIGVALSHTTAQDVLDVQQSSNTLLFDCTVSESVRAGDPARWVYDLEVSADGGWQASLHAAAGGANNSAGCGDGVCTGPSGLTPPLSLRPGEGDSPAGGVGASASRPPSGTIPKWGNGLTAMSTAAGARALAQARVADPSCMAVAVVDGYPTYALAMSRSSAACAERPRGAAQKYVLERHDGVWESIWQGAVSCPPALPATVIRVMFHVAVSSCWDS